MKVISYKDSGVNIDKGDAFIQTIKPIVESTFRPEVLTKIGGFAGCFSLNLERYKKPIVVASTDGACHHIPKIVTKRIKRLEEIEQKNGESLTKIYLF